MDLSSVRAGWDVYGSDGEKIGDVGDVGSNYLMVTKGFLFTKDIYIPTSAIKSIDQDRVYINVAKDQIDSMGWDQAPAGDAGYGTTTTDTTTGTYTDQDSTSVQSATTTTDAGYVTQPSQGYTTTERSAPTQTGDVDDDIRVRRHEEELQAQKVSREAGEVRVSKDVVEEQQTLEVPVTREQITVRSTDVRSTDADTSQAFQGGTISVPVREEGVEVNKQVRVAEELEIDKTAVQDTERVTDTVRKERVNVEEVGDVDVEGGTGTTRRT
jgi:uncharacterized protein (TIGR02271 family)